MATETKVHIHLRAADLERSRAFYSKLFGEPVKSKPGYLKFLPEIGPLNLAVSQRSEQPTGAALDPIVMEAGIQLDSNAAVHTELARVKQAGLNVQEEMGSDCCHANQDKFWLRDPDGFRWEVYHLNYDIEEETAQALPVHQAGCCS